MVKKKDWQCQQKKEAKYFSFKWLILWVSLFFRWSFILKSLNWKEIINSSNSSLSITSGCILPKLCRQHSLS